MMTCFTGVLYAISQKQSQPKGKRCLLYGMIPECMKIARLDDLLSQIKIPNTVSNDLHVLLFTPDTGESAIYQNVDQTGKPGKPAIKQKPKLTSESSRVCSNKLKQSFCSRRFVTVLFVDA